MDENIKYYVVKQKALPEVLLKVAQANRLIETKGILLRMPQNRLVSAEVLITNIKKIFFHSVIT